MQGASKDSNTRRRGRWTSDRHRKLDSDGLLSGKRSFASPWHRGFIADATSGTPAQGLRVMGSDVCVRLFRSAAAARRLSIASDVIRPDSCRLSLGFDAPCPETRSSSAASPAPRPFHTSSFFRPHTQLNGAGPRLHAPTISSPMALTPCK